MRAENASPTLKFNSSPRAEKLLKVTNPKGKKKTQTIRAFSGYVGVSKNRGESPQNGWFTMENPFKMDDLGGPPLFLEGHPAIICRMFIISTSCPLGCCSTKWAVLQNMFKLSRIKVSPKIPLIWRCSQVHTTLPPTIMEVENGGLEDDWLVSKGAIFHFHDYGRKSIQTK